MGRPLAWVATRASSGSATCTATSALPSLAGSPSVSDNVPGMPGRGPGAGPGALARGAPRVRPHNLWGTVSRIWLYFGGERRLILLVAAFILFDSALGMTVPFLIGK